MVDIGEGKERVCAVDDILYPAAITSKCSGSYIDGSHTGVSPQSIASH